MPKDVWSPQAVNLDIIMNQEFEVMCESGLQWIKLLGTSTLFLFKLKISPGAPAVYPYIHSLIDEGLISSDWKRRMISLIGYYAFAQTEMEEDVLDTVAK